MVRFKNRYLLVEAYVVDDKRGLVDFGPHAGAALSTHTLVSALRSTLAAQFGLHGAAATAQSLSVKYCNAATGCAIVRAARDLLPMVWAAITLLGDGRVWRVVHVSGTIASAQRVAMRHIVARLEALQRDAKEGEKAAYVELISKCRTAIRSVDA